jgi:hypothetical protein
MGKSGFRQIIRLDKIASAAILESEDRESKSFMTASDWRRKRKILSLVILFCTLSAFTVDVFDLREELGILSYPDSGMDDNITTGVINSVAIEPEPIRMACSVQPEASVEVASIDRLSNGFRAPPSV